MFIPIAFASCCGRSFLPRLLDLDWMIDSFVSSDILNGVDGLSSIIALGEINVPSKYITVV